MRFVRFDDIPSTSGHARAEIASGRLTSQPVAFVAATQSAGVGRFHREWQSPPGGLWLTLAWPTSDPDLSSVLDGLGLRIGIGCLRIVARALADAPGDPHVRLKWPNDILVRGRKVLGVLTEVVHGPPPEARPWVLVGVGINANIDLAALREDVRSHATSLAAELGRPVDLAALERDLVEELRIALSTHGLARDLITEAAKHLHGLDRDTTVSLPDGTRITGVLKGLNEHGMAVLDIEGRVFVPPLGSVIMNDQSPRNGH
ncbi:MAG TPA: biotin--[acetyl-CoA-carboxylase] ligase [Phycisphaerales bacterium]|nr:biotin--[acetyl-CoA-carboxylase] ligase [Phycisphaerales bacterium]